MMVAGWVMCAVVLAITLALGKRRRYVGVIGVQIACLLGPLFLLSTFVTSLVGQTILLAILACVALCANISPAKFTKWAVALTVAVLVLNAAFGWYTFQETIKCREQLAFEPIKNRLHRHEAEPAGAVTPRPPMQSDTLERLTSLEKDFASVFRRGEARSRAIQRLHENSVQQFINSPGFGVTRMSGWDRHLLKPNDHRPIPQPETSEPQYFSDSDVPDEEANRLNPMSDESLQRIHLAALADFTNPEGFGYQDRQGRVAGFESHGFSEIPTEYSSPESWTLARVELVSLLKDSEPSVYVSEYLPRMDELRGAPTRPLVPFESRAIGQLKAGQDLVVENSGNQLFAVGSLRAMTRCLNCHSVNRGDLLGAFSYEFRTTLPRPTKPQPGA